MDAWERLNRMMLPLWATYAAIFLALAFLGLPLVMLLDGSLWFFYPFAVIWSLLGGWLIGEKVYRMTIIERTPRSLLIRLDRRWPAGTDTSYRLESGHSTPGGTMTETPADPNPTPAPPPPVQDSTVVKWDSERRKQALATAVANEVRAGWNVQSQTDYQAVMNIPAEKTNHILHLILTIVTLGLWALVWIAMVVIHKGERREVISVDEYGNTNIQR
jgi:hypothetical protein